MLEVTARPNAKFVFTHAYDPSIDKETNEALRRASNVDHNPNVAQTILANGNWPTEINPRPNNALINENLTEAGLNIRLVRIRWLHQFVHIQPKQ